MVRDITWKKMNLIALTFLKANPHLKPYIFYSNVLAIWHGLSADIRDTKVNYGRYSAAAILNLMGLTFFKAYPHLKMHILF